jgi:hypothetical protein
LEFVQSCWERNTTDRISRDVIPPCTTGNIPAHHYFNWNYRYLSTNHHARIRNRKYVVLYYRRAPIKPVFCELRENLPLTWNSCDDPIERTQTVSSDQHALTVAHVTVANLADVALT